MGDKVEGKAKSECPPSFRCPISHEVMRDPVCTCDGHTFERASIEQWLTTRDTSPLTGLRLESRTLVPNVALRNSIEEFFGGYATEHANQINFSDIELDQEIGSGRDKTVYEGLWRGKRVAVLRVQKGACDGEAGVLARLSKHASLVRFYGMASNGEFDYLVTDLAPRGSLDTVLEKYEEQGTPVCAAVMMAAAHQICEGMEAVTSEGLIHRDLACRNVLCFSLDPDDPALTDVKVSDFGLSRSGNTFYGGDAAVPVRWMPPESLQRRRWSEKSDIWAFGVTLWEMFSYGCIPYADIGSDRDVFQLVVAGERLPRPRDCPEAVFKVMQACWQKRPEDRPTFRSLRIMLRDAEKEMSVAEALANARSAPAAKAAAASDTKRSGSDSTPAETDERIRAAVAGMTAAPADPAAQEEGARALANLASSAYGRVHAARAGAIEALIAAMGAHRGVKQVQECAVAALSNLSASNPENQTRIAARGGIEALVAAMREHQTKAVLQQYAATALRNLTLHNSENKTRIAAAGGIVAVIEAMRTHRDVAAVQQYGADALQNIALHNGENKVMIAANGGITVLVQAMRTHLDEARVQQYVCFALANLAANNAANAALIAKEGAIPDIIAAMTRHQGKPGVQRYGASAIKYLAGENTENQTEIARAGGVKALIAAMRTHRTNDAVQQYAASALKNLAANNTENKTAIAELGGIGVLLAAMRSHRMKPLVQQHAASALQNLAGNHPENKTRIAAEGGIPLIIAAMANHPNQSQVQRYAASALKNLSSDNAENKLLIARDGGIEALVHAVSMAAEAEVLQYASGALQNIAANNAFTKAEVVRLGGVAALETALTSAAAADAGVRSSLESALRVLRC